VAILEFDAFETESDYDYVKVPPSPRFTTSR
jgi:hypothetical protein